MLYVTRNEAEGVNDLKGRRSNALLMSAAIAALMVGHASPAHAQVEPVQLEGIIIEGGTLSGEPQDAATLGSASTVITGEELERRQIRHAADALRTVPGLAVGRTGGVGGLTQVRVRGAEGNQVKVIIDGVEVNSLSDGEFDFATLLATDIERIEVIRGPQSGIYGANALAGVINIVTRKGAREPRVAVEAEVGGLGTRVFSANASGAGEFGYLSVSAAHRETDGFNIARSGSEDDGSEQQTIFARAGFTPTDYFRIDVMGRFQENDTDIDDFVGGITVDQPSLFSLREQILGSVSAQLDLFDKRWSQKIFADYLDDELNGNFFLGPGSFGTFFNIGERTRYGYQSTAKFVTSDVVRAEHTFVGLIEQVGENFDNGSDRIAERENTGYSIEYRGAFAKQFYVTGNIRYDDKDAFDDATTYRLTAAYRFSDMGTRLHGSYGKGITDPTFFELFGRTSDFAGNPNLKPEESIGWDVGVEQKFFDGLITADLTYFQADLTDKIAGFNNSVRNETGESKRQGVEVSLSAQVTPALLLTGSYTYLDATRPDGEEEERRPPHTGSLSAVYSFANDRGKINVDAIYNGETFDRAPTPAQLLDDYLLVNVAASYKLDEKFELFGRVENLLDEDYEEVFGYSTAPVTAYGGVKLTLGDAPAPLEPALK